MREKCEAFGVDVVRAIREGRQTQDRRPFKRQPSSMAECPKMLANKKWIFHYENGKKHKAPWQVGDVILVRESATVIELGWDCPPDVFLRLRYESDGVESDWIKLPNRLEWTPTIGHKLPNGTFREACRTRLKITRVWAERLQDISEEDSWREGCLKGELSDNGVDYFPAEIPDGPNSWIGWDTAKEWFGYFWNSFYGHGPYSWKSNPWVWCREFEVMK